MLALLIPGVGMGGGAAVVGAAIALPWAEAGAVFFVHAALGQAFAPYAAAGGAFAPHAAAGAVI